jgi:hypothetical protein
MVMSGSFDSLEEILARGEGARVTVRLTRLWGRTARSSTAVLRTCASSLRGRVVLITVREPDWAEASPGDWNRTGLVVEDYLMEVLRDVDPT